MRGAVRRGVDEGVGRRGGDDSPNGGTFLLIFRDISPWAAASPMKLMM